MVLIVIVLAVVACCLGGALGALTLLRPQDALVLVGLRGLAGSTLGTSEARSFGGVLLVSHASTAAALGYAPGTGAPMALGLAMMWLGAGIGRGFAILQERPKDALQWRFLAVDVLMSVTLALPMMLASGILDGGGVHV